MAVISPLPSPFHQCSPGASPEAPFAAPPSQGKQQPLTSIPFLPAQLPDASHTLWCQSLRGHGGREALCSLAGSWASAIGGLIWETEASWPHPDPGHPLSLASCLPQWCRPPPGARGPAPALSVLGWVQIMCPYHGPGEEKRIYNFQGATVEPLMNKEHCKIITISHRWLCWQGLTLPQVSRASVPVLRMTAALNTAVSILLHPDWVLDTGLWTL